MTFDETLDELNITIGDTEDVTFTPEDKIRALTKAWKDGYVVKTVLDSTLTFSVGTYQYAKPTAITTVKDIYISTSNNTVTDPPTKIDKSLWEVVDGNIHFREAAYSLIPTGTTLYVKGNYKLTTDDTLPTSELEEYVIALAGYNTLTVLTFKKANLFLKNDTTLSELIALRRELKQEVMEYRASQVREFESM